MKKIKLLLNLFIVAICFMLVSSCYEDLITYNKVVPIFQGVSLADAEGNAAPRKLAGYGSEDIENEIKKDFGIMESVTIEYFASKGDKAYITLNFYNPDQFEILSFVLNGTKYQSYQFTEDSTSTQIKVAIQIPEHSGLMEYKVEQVKYIDGTEIKDCIMQGNTTVQVGVEYDNHPYTVDNIKPHYEDANFNVNIYDTDDLVEKSHGKYRIYVYDEKGIVASRDINKGFNDISFENLDVNQFYNYLVVASYDCYDGRGMSTNIVKQGEFKTDNYVNVVNKEIEDDRISFEIEKSFQGSNIIDVSLYCRGELVKKIDGKHNLFDQLMSNTEYEVVIKYTVNNKEYQYSYKFTTGKKETPKLNLTLDSEKRSISYNIGYVDNYNILKIKAVQLLKDGIVVSVKNTFDGKFDNLLSNSEYTVEVQYYYNMNDGTKDVTETISETIKTKELTKPTYGFTYDLTTTTLKGNLIISDIDKTSKVTSVELYNSVSNELINFSNE